MFNNKSTKEVLNIIIFVIIKYKKNNFKYMNYYQL